MGDTKVAAGIVTSEGEIMTQTRVPMLADGDATAGFAAVQAAVDSLFVSAPRASIRNSAEIPGRPAARSSGAVCQGRFRAAFCD